MLMPMVLACGCKSVTGPDVTILIPAIQGRVVSVGTGDPLEGARVQRLPAQTKEADPFETKGAQRLKQPLTVRCDASGRFHFPPEKGGYLLVSPPLVYEFRLRAWHGGHEGLVTNIDLVRIRPYKTNDVLTVDVGDLALLPSAESAGEPGGLRGGAVP